MTFDKVSKITDKTDGWLKPIEVKFLYEQARKLKNNGVIVEIGSYKGKSTICLAGGSEEGTKTKVYAIDPHMTDLEQKVFNKGISSVEEFKNNIKNSGLRKFVELIVKKSEDAVKNWDKPIEFLWIDGDHTYEGAKLDFDLWSPFLVPGGIVAYHDSDGPTVQCVIKERIFSSLYFSNTGFAGSISFATKESEPISFFESIRNKIVFFFIIMPNTLQKIPVPQSVRILISKFGKTLFSMVKR